MNRLPTFDGQRVGQKAFLSTLAILHGEVYWFMTHSRCNCLMTKVHWALTSKLFLVTCNGKSGGVRILTLGQKMVSCRRTLWRGSGGCAFGSASFRESFQECWSRCYVVESSVVNFMLIRSSVIQRFQSLFCRIFCNAGSRQIVRYHGKRVNGRGFMEVCVLNNTTKAIKSSIETDSPVGFLARQISLS